ncbi:MAG: hypothetical protein A3A96_00485 [Candidatus Zambryskibacteria bacterium RIFCSPLOWO2_01_FULL_39_39]|uniref:DUF4412 domain-containing protein n=1 Tax=Candidatus Zambryskibacteria bacterium RIFCSPLOWO2_01_FULL_39_39 TaxID=1802758 RepID=A0A1G2TXJ9_9BACT|nr:MAG: hypothetical protein UT00_C0001G0009 [Parcubacteria group bacterium GW2011_GWA1_38_7]OHA87815.1 MAG: hypothetical protein A2644_01410 [Candidatus Zambryskibacteria bacterium RIFCSPHIGHO2_01_FULL_39_63]OHA94960.1 MAG: hypothetical protein A3B88_01105 [Candidatus Zambryskibacteria bacterium RIFCSPHIGHO2_02_FULL_39_19]OHA99141.1 MAG: hypothetical protein A3F20_03055 [Candidatus Zambryskibacteria bacterium RIFCSPHIGHO2_12_FULL_39_21]OHB01903.1 MAG: hypothetical protein A3A96_00485 [Candidat
MKNKITFWLGVIAVVVVGILVYVYGSKSATPIVAEDGKINGNYTIESIMKLGKPYICTFEKSDGISKIAGVVHTDGSKIYEEFRIRTDASEAKEFNSFLIIKDEEAFIWTSLQNIGYKSSVAKSASRNASPQEQAQIIGTKDEMSYKCEIWPEVDNTIFEPPTWVKFSELNN